MVDLSELLWIIRDLFHFSAKVYSIELQVIETEMSISILIGMVVTISC